MKTGSNTVPPTVPRRAVWTGVPWLILMLLAGCATPNDVALMVARSNSAMVAGEVGMPEPSGAVGTDGWQESWNRLETFIAAHPNLSDVTGPLRIRQAMLLLGHGQIGLAQAAFHAVEIWDLHLERDQVLKRNQEILLWWFANSGEQSWNGEDQAQAENALTRLAQETARLDHNPEIRDYLAELGAWIGLAAVQQTVSIERSREWVEDALNIYARIFTDDDFAVLADRTERLPDPAAPGPVVQRRLRAPMVLDKARQVNQSADLRARPENAFIDAWINAQGG
jgi:hypothetical protein